jgi:hypothetical protein
MRRTAFVMGCCCSALAACAHSTPGVDVATLGRDVGRLRDAFNANADRVRLVLLVSPS